MADDHDNDNDVTVLLTNDHVDKLRDTLRGTNISITRLESVTRELIESNSAIVKNNNALIKSHNALIKSNKERVGELRKSRKLSAIASALVNLEIGRTRGRRPNKDRRKGGAR